MSYQVTVLLPTLNAASYLAGAMVSLTRQTFKNFKVMVVDGGSADNTIAIAKGFPELSVEILSCGPVGLGKQLRAGLERIDTPYTARLDADDISLPARLERQLQILEADRELAIVGSQIELIAGERIARGAALPILHEDIRRLLKSGFPAFCHPSVMFRTELARGSRAYSISGLGEDLDFYLRMTEAGRGYNSEEILHQYRLHPASASFTSFAEIKKHYSFALACAHSRDLGRQEPAISDYTAEWNRRSWLKRIATRLECFGTALYRKSRILSANGRALRGSLGIVFSVVLRPALVRARVLILMSEWRSRATS